MGTDLYKHYSSQSTVNHDKNSCAVIAAAILTDTTYEYMYDLYARLGRRKGHGSSIYITRKAFFHAGYRLTCICRVADNERCPCLRFDQFTVLHSPPHSPKASRREAPMRLARGVTSLERVAPSRGSYLVWTSRHLLALKDGIVHDHSRGGRRRIKGIFRVEPI